MLPAAAGQRGEAPQGVPPGAAGSGGVAGRTSGAGAGGRGPAVCVGTCVFTLCLCKQTADVTV